MYVWHRTTFRAWACAVALCGVQVAQAQTAAGTAEFQRFMATTVGNVTTVNIGSNGTPLAASPQTGLPTGNGWIQAGNFGVAKGTTAEGLKLGARASIGLPQGRSIPLTITSGITPANLVKGFRALAGPGIIFTGLPMLLQWMADSGVSPNPDATGAGNQFLFKQPGLCYTAPCYEYRASPASNIPANWYGTVEAACRAQLTAQGNGNYVSSTTTLCYFTTNSGGNGQMGIVSRTVAPVVGSGLPKSMDDIAPYMQAKQPEPGVVNEMLSRGVKLDVNTPTVTGPSSVPGPTSTSTDSAGKVSTTAITYKPTYNDNRVTNNIETTVTSYNPATGETTVEQTKVEEAPEPEEKEDACEANPDRVGCADLDTPDAEVPKETVNLEYNPEDLGLGDGQCPAPIVQSLAGRSVTVYDYGPACDLLTTYVRPLFLLLSAFIAFVIIAPGASVIPNRGET